MPKQMLGLGSEFNVVAKCDGVTIPMKDCGAVTFVHYDDTSGATMTLTELDSTGTNSEQALAVMATLHKGPGTGGTWTAVSQTAASTYLTADATNDATVVTVLASQLSAGYDSVQMTSDGEDAHFAIMHDLKEQRDPANLPTNIVA